MHVRVRVRVGVSVRVRVRVHVCFVKLHSPIAGSRMKKLEKIPPLYNIYKMILSHHLELIYILSP